MPSIKCGNCRGTHGSVGEVKDCYALSEHEEMSMKAELEAERRNERFFEERGAYEPDDPREIEAQMRDDEARAGALLDQMTGAPGRDMASEKQIKYATDLLAEREWPDKLEKHDLENMERRQVSKLIDGLKRAPKKQGELNLDPEVGMYIDRETNTAFRFYLGQQSGRVLVKQLVSDGEDSVMDIGTGKQKLVESWSYKYVGNAQKVMRLYKLERMTLEEAKRFGKMSGMCVVCGRRLDVPESVEAGIGPICANKDW